MSGTFLASISHLEGAREAARWIGSAAKETERGLLWLPEPDHPEKSTTVSGPMGIYSGSAGIVLFLLELANATGDVATLADATRGADYLAATWRDALSTTSMLNPSGPNLDFQQGLSGLAFVLVEAARLTQNNRYREAAVAIADQVVAEAKATSSGVTWGGAPTIGLGDGGIVLFLLWAARELASPSYLDLATRAGHHILALAQPDRRGGVRWDGPSMERYGVPAGAAMPNFELGTAGVAFVLARLFEETGDQRFLEGGRAGAAHVQALATVKDDAALVYYREPDHTDLYYLGYCHGPVGTARLFYQLYQMTGEPAYLTWTEQLARGIVASGVPEKQAPGLWNVVCQCCGTAGVLDFFVSLWQVTQRAEYRQLAERVAGQLLSRASNLDGKGYRWYQAWTRVQPWNVTAETGYMIGAAGVGSALLHLHLAEEGRYAASLFPDNPFPRAAPAATGRS
jgi:lantibiotic modifying enzyme